jgi:hypothetical protein
VMGQAAGTAAALSHKTQSRPVECSVPMLQALLAENGAFLGI